MVIALLCDELMTVQYSILLVLLLFELLVFSLLLGAKLLEVQVGLVGSGEKTTLMVCGKFVGCSFDSFIWESLWCAIYDKWPESLLCAMEASIHAECITHILWDTSDYENYSCPGEDFVGPWTSSLLNSLP